MNGRVILAGLLAGLTVFVWSAISHTAVHRTAPVPNEATVMAALHENVKAKGIYVFPFPEDEAKWDEAYRTNPHGLLVVTPPGEPMSFGKVMATEALTDFAGGILAAFLFVAAGLGAAGIGSRIAFGAALGGFASLAVDFSYWNWYGFPTSYLATQLVDGIVAWSLAALVLGLVLRRR